MESSSSSFSLNNDDNVGSILDFVSLIGVYWDCVVVVVVVVVESSFSFLDFFFFRFWEGRSNFDGVCYFSSASFTWKDDGFLSLI